MDANFSRPKSKAICHMCSAKNKYSISYVGALVHACAWVCMGGEKLYFVKLFLRKVKTKWCNYI